MSESNIDDFSTINSAVTPPETIADLDSLHDQSQPPSPKPLFGSWIRFLFYSLVTILLITWSLNIHTMVLNYMDPKPMSESNFDGSSTIYRATTPPETVASDLNFLSDQDPLGTFKSSTSSVPWPGSTFIIRSASSGEVITLLDGGVVLARPGGPGSIHWACIETKGWIGFRNSISGRFLGHDAQGNLRCGADRQQGWENFCVRMKPDGGYVLLMTHHDRLWNVGVKMQKGVEKLAKVGEKESDGITWEFVKV